MEKRVGILERVAGLLVGVAFIIIGLLLLLLGLTFLPVIGVVTAIPVMGMSNFFLCPQASVETADEHVHSLAYMAKAA